jgi:heptosyltransferase-2
MKKIIVRMPNWVGDVVMATPILADLRKAFPDSLITAMCQSTVADLLREDRNIDELFVFQRPSNSFGRREEKRDIIAKIQAGNFDLGILLTHSFSSAWWFWAASVKKRIGYAAHWRRWLLTDPISLPKQKMHQVDLYKEILKPLAISHSKTLPSLFVTEKEQKEAKALLLSKGYKEGKKLIGINAGASFGSAKCWLPERFRALALDLIKEDVFVVFFGDLGTSNLVKQICDCLPERVINLAGLTNLRELMCLIQASDVFVTNDSGPMHIAAAFRTPLVALFGSTDEDVTGPYRTSLSVINKHVKCSPCLKRTCPIDFRCMTQISVEEVSRLVREKLYV